MKYVRLWLSIGLLLAAGMVRGQVQEKKAALEYKDPHYPLHVGSQWRYAATVNDAPQQKVVITVDQAENYEYKFTLDKKPESTELVVRFRLKVVSGSKELTENVGVLRNGAYRFATAGATGAVSKEITPPLRFLKLPFMKGDSWSVNSISEGAQVSGTFTSEEDTVKVPLGSFPAIHVVCQDFQVGAKKMAMEQWFARNVGLVKQSVRVGNIVSLLELEDYKQGK